MSPRDEARDQLIDELQALAPHSPVTVYNRGVNGEVTSEMLARFDRDVFAADLGSSPIGFRSTTVVGGIVYLTGVPALVAAVERPAPMLVDVPRAPAAHAVTLLELRDRKRGAGPSVREAHGLHTRTLGGPVVHVKADPAPAA